MKKVIIAGSRKFNDFDKLKWFCDLILTDYDGYDIEIVSGGNRTWIQELGTYVGADFLGECYAHVRNYPLNDDFQPDWDTHGKAAGPIRNQAMAEYGDVLIAFWDGKSKGTKDMIDKANKEKLDIYVHVYNELCYYGS